MSLTRFFAQAVATLDDAALPAAARQCATQAIADCLGGALAGAAAPAGQIGATLAGADAQPGAACTLWGQATRAGARDAALVNGCAAHVHALDDTHESMRGHPSAPVLPAAFALAEALDRSGRELVTAYLLGVEVAARLGRSVNDRHAQLGWHTTSTLGAVGAAAAAARLLRLDADRTAHALGIAASTAGGLRVNFGTMTKALHAGLAAQHGVLAAQLAAGGMTASPEALEGHEGFLALFCAGGQPDAARAMAPLQAPFEAQVPGIVFKLYPTCSLMHALIDMVLQARAQGVLAGAPLDGIDCGISLRLEAARGKGDPWPRDGLAAKFHVEYCVATALLHGTQGLDDFTDEALLRPGLRTLAGKVRVHIGEDFPAGNGDFASLRLHGGGKLLFEGRRAKPLGHPSAPLPAAQHRHKFMTHAVASLPAAHAERLYEALGDLESLRTRDVAALLAAPPSTSDLQR